VTKWTARSKVPGTVFSKDLLIIPIHCHGNHWTLAVIIIKLKRFEYYDSLRGGPLMVLENLRQSLQVRPSWRWHL
jgi:Ulp1 family protease